MWRCWVGFNASHSMGLILFGLVFGYLALAHGKLLFQSTFLLVVGLAMLSGVVVLCKVYFFSVPSKASVFLWRLLSGQHCAIANLAMRSTDDAFAEAYQSRAEWMSYLKVDPQMDALRGYFRYATLLKRMGL